MTGSTRLAFGFLRLAAALLVAVAVGALASIALMGPSTGSASAAYYGYCPGGSASAVYYGYCPPPRVPAHFIGYTLTNPTPAIPGENLVLEDQFIRETLNRGQPPQLLLVPVEKRRQGRPPEPIQRADEYQKCWRLTGGRRQDRSVRVSNQFVQNRELIVREPFRLCAPAVVTLQAPPTTVASDTQHYKCYRVEERPRLADEMVDLVDQFGTLRVVVRRAELLCTPTKKERSSGEKVVAPRPEEHLVCYGIVEQAVFPPRTVFTRDQFGSQRVRVIDPLVLCVPSTKTP
jgi:hypothetical protein